MREVSEATIRRLPVYHHYLLKTKEMGIAAISSTQIASDLNLTPIQVRKDLEATGLKGKPKVGYAVSDLLGAIETFLEWNKINPAILIGAGHLGYAILGYQGFEHYGLKIAAAFDNDFAKIGKLIHGKPIYSIDSMEKYIREHKTEVGILTVPASSAQELADIMISAGIKAIWSFAPARITTSAKDVIIQHENLASSLAVLFKNINKKSL
ncbi:redox-sensing transcriptional repressor Rex [Endomicrobium proavitum]|uniref:Redox-sensing transcriptional repressor Rex n=1 Tax=Endomicrobium proavitum TaxID=1408281 RepID=A0A0G3WJQ3_9BACT|nr:redox-sensing transcriptional repressor Rex [Endomicrobium proavitum]AKL98110.1 Redox-sensing transcriptional repressor Rex [Endomicrobium proavitum]